MAKQQPKSPINGQPLPRGKPFTSETAREARLKRAADEKAVKSFREALLTELANDNNYKVLAKAAIENAKNNPRYWELIRDTIGEKPTDKLDMTAKADGDFVIKIGKGDEADDMD